MQYVIKNGISLKLPRIGSSYEDTYCMFLRIALHNVCYHRRCMGCHFDLVRLVLYVQTDKVD